MPRRLAGGVIYTELVIYQSISYICIQSSDYTSPFQARRHKGLYDIHDIVYAMTMPNAKLPKIVRFGQVEDPYSQYVH